MKNRLVLLLLLFTSLALAGPSEPHYTTVRNPGTANGTAIASHRTVSSGDSTSSTTPIDPQPTSGDQLIVVAPRFGTAAASCQVEVWLYQDLAGTRTFMGIADVQTATAGDGSMQRTAGGQYLPNRVLYFDSAGADVYDVRYPVISSGSIYSWAWTAGSGSKAAQ